MKMRKLNKVGKKMQDEGLVVNEANFGERQQHDHEMKEPCRH